MNTKQTEEEDDDEQSNKDTDWPRRSNNYDKEDMSILKPQAGHLDSMPCCVDGIPTELSLKALKLSNERQEVLQTWN